jgi:hypothetical protein
VKLTPKANQPNQTAKGKLEMSSSYPQPDGFSVAEKAGSNLIFGKMVKFTVDGKFKIDKADTLPDYTHLVATDVTAAWVNWRGGKPLEHRITYPGQLHPDREDLPDQDKASWERGLNGEPADPWRDTRYLRLIDPRTGQDYTFVTDTYGGRKALGDLKSQIGNVRFAYPGAVPLIQLCSTMMKTAFGLKPRPEFKVIDWRNKNDSAVQFAPDNNRSGGCQAKLIEPPFNDQMPSFDEELIPWE